MVTISSSNKIIHLGTINFSTQDPLAATDTDTDPTIYFVSDTCSCPKRKKRKRPNDIVPKTQFLPTNSESKSTSAQNSATNQHILHADSDGDPPLINVSHHRWTDEETIYDEEFDMDNIPFVRHSQPSSSNNKTHNKCAQLWIVYCGQCLCSKHAA